MVLFEILIYLLLAFVALELWYIGDMLGDIKGILKGIRIRQSEILRQTKTDLPPDWWEAGKDEKDAGH